MPAIIHSRISGTDRAMIKTRRQKNQRKMIVITKQHAGRNARLFLTPLFLRLMRSVLVNARLNRRQFCSVMVWSVLAGVFSKTQHFGEKL